ncbi:restriction endonuclease S subunit, partial [Chryseobacterium sp. 2987]|nr:restriction endonuclease S subunit [Chryseobacterium sp. 2987]
MIETANQVFKKGKVPNLRFFGFTQDWERKKLGEIGETYSGLSGKTKEDFGTGKPYIQYKQVFDNS